MFRFFTEKHWFVWSWIGSFIILSSLWVQVEIDVKINEWFGVFYDMIQKALAEPNAVTIEEYFASLFSFITLAGMYIAVYVAISFFTAHYLFRWRTSMVEWYHSVYDKARKIEGASQRVQEDTIKFTRIMEGLGTSLIESIMILIQFIPILFGLSIGIPIFFFGEWEYGLIVGALIWTIGGTVFLIVLGFILRLVGIEYDLQKQEAAASCFCKSYSIPTSLNIKPSTIKNTVPPIVQIKAPTINPYSHSPKKKIGIPILNPNNIGINCIKIIIDSIKLVPNPSMILVNFIVSSCTL